MARPSLYKPEYCQILIEHMAKGLSFESFGAITNTCEDTLYEWAKVHPEFSEAKKTAYMKNRLFWEQKGLENIDNKAFNSTIWIFNMKNRFPKQWREKVEVEAKTEAEIKHDPQDIKMISEFVNTAKEFMEKNK